jgi:alkane 1-monooxygenase
VDGKTRYERCRPEHSWNSNNVASNVFLYHLQRHSDHHANPVRRYQALRHYDEVPELPSGYATMIVLAYLPPVWSRVMDKRVLAHYGGDAGLANLHPRKREKLLARYGSGGVTREAEGERPGAAAGIADADALECPGCGYVYSVERGAPREGFPAGTRWSDVPDDWACPDCGVREKRDFVPARKAVASA